jgi:acetylornithine deacetylase/succinyl-diaminopimelate desuccinylase-like protein
MSASRAITYVRAHRKKSLAELNDFIQFPSISAQPKHEGDIRRCANWLARHLRRIGLDDVRIIPTPRHPIVFASWQGAPRRPTVIIYGHYDVQPVDPLNQWRSPPFEPTIRADDLFGRGACDDKGQMFTHVKALEAYLQTKGALPVNVKCLFEGEEEIGSPNLLPFVVRNKACLAADAAVMSDTRMLGPKRPAINYAERGALYLEIEVHGPQHDLHSGNFGGAIHNPLQALCEMIAKLHDANGRIAVPGVYDNVRSWSTKERAYMARAGPSDDRILEDAQTELGWGERSYSLYERLTLRPALTFNGISGGYQGPGGKGVIPARATAKLSFRLVPDQNPQEIDQLFRKHIARITPPTVRAIVRTISHAEPVLIDMQHPAIRAARLAYRKGFGAAPVLMRSGGTIPILSVFQKTLGIPTVLMGFALPDDRMHAPNERFHIPTFFRGIETSIWFMDALASAHGLDLCPSRRPGRDVAEKNAEAIL